VTLALVSGLSWTINIYSPDATEAQHDAAVAEYAARITIARAVELSRFSSLHLPSLVANCLEIFASVATRRFVDL
jgi:hypothetical protein